MNCVVKPSRAVFRKFISIVDVGIAEVLRESIKRKLAALIRVEKSLKSILNRKIHRLSRQNGIKRPLSSAFLTLAAVLRPTDRILPVASIVTRTNPDLPSGRAIN